MNDDSISKSEETRLLEVDRDIDEYKQELEAIAYLKETKRQRNKQLINTAKIIVMVIIFIFIVANLL